MIKRDVESAMTDAIKSFDSITVLGPRQSGKTTLVRNLFSDYRYINLEHPEDRLIFSEDPKLVFEGHNKIILDEIQQLPLLLSYAQIYLDTRKYKIVFTGSNQIDLRSGINQSLAGRTAIFKLLPFSLHELKNRREFVSVNEWLFKGFYPVLYEKNQDPTLTYRSYYETYIQRDIRQTIRVMDMLLFDKFVRLCAGRAGQIMNFSGLSNELGIAVNTVKSWLSVLEYTFICYLLPPFYSNISKRLLKSPKLYFYDVGMLCYLLGIENHKQLETHPLRGAIFENMIMNEFVKSRFNAGKDFNGYFYRDHHGTEIDYLSPHAHGMDAYEVKSAFTFTKNFMRSLNLVSKVEGMQIDSKNIIYNGETKAGPDGVMLYNYLDFFAV